MKRNVMHKDDIKICTQVPAMLFQLRGASNIVQSVGWCDTTIVLDKVSVNLNELIKKIISLENALKTSLDISKGVQQLHFVPMGFVVHSDTKSENFLLMVKKLCYLMVWITYVCQI